MYKYKIQATILDTSYYQYMLKNMQYTAKVSWIKYEIHNILFLR